MPNLHPEQPMQQALITLPMLPPQPAWEAQPQPPTPQYYHPPERGTAPRPRKPYTTTKVREMWTPEEHDRMLEGLRRYKRDWAKVTKFVGTRTPAQVRSHAQKYFDKVARDKTDEYVPRARPKRKSTAPYPRKIRDDKQALQQFRIPVVHPQPHPQPHPHPQPQQQFDVPVFAHSVPIAPGQSPILSHVPPTYVQPQQAMSSHVVQRVFSPYVEPRAIHPTPEIQASPMSYMSSQTYTSPQLAQQTIAVPTPLYGVLSPITPAPYAYPSRTPSVTHTPVTLYQQPIHRTMSVPTPRHSHPEGPLDNCAKCAALQRYGAVLQEIGELNASHGPDHVPTIQNPPGVSPVKSSGYHKPALRDGSTERVENREAPSSSGSLSPSKNRIYEPSPHSSEAVARFSHAPAGNRAYRAKVMRARKMKGALGKDASHSWPNEYEEHSESGNSMQEDRRWKAEHKSTLAHEPSRVTDTTSKKRKIASGNCRGDKFETTNKRRNVSQNKTHLRRASHGREKKELGGKSGPSAEISKRQAHKAATNDKRSPSPKSDESETGPHSPLVEAYSPKERMELFDAVHSLQILAKTSSSRTPSPRSRRDPPNSESG